MPAGRAVRQLWSQPIAVAPRGVALAREKGWLLAWDDKHWLYLLNAQGERQGQARTPKDLTVACCAEDGTHYAAAGSKGEVWWLAPDLVPRWERSVPHRAVAAAMDPFGQYLAVADSRGAVRLFDRYGRAVSQLQSPRPLHHLAFIPSAPLLVGSADYGLVTCFDLAGHWVWRDGLVAHVGSLAASGDGSRIMLACFTEGLQGYSLAGQKTGRLPLAEPCRLAALTFDGSLTAVAGLSNRLVILDADGRTLSSYLLTKPAAALALAALGESAVVGLADGPLLGVDLRE
jgi:hypothetical protein